MDARYYLVTLQLPHGHALFIFHFSDKDSVETFNQKRHVSSVVKSQRQMFLQVSQLRKRRGGQRNQADPTEGRTGPVRLHSCLLVFVCFSLSGLAIRQQIALRPTSLLCRPPAALLSNHPERATRWDTLTLASDVMQDFQKKRETSSSCTVSPKLDSNADTHTLPNDRNANSYTSGCERIPLLTPNPLKPVLLAVKEATCALQSCDRWWAKRYETSKRARENNFIVAAQSRVPAPRFSQFLSLSWLQARGREHRGPLQEQAKTRADWRKCRSAVFLSRCRPRSDNDGLKTVILKFREVFWVRRQWSPNTGMRRISRPPMRFPLYLSRDATRGWNYRLSSSTEFYGHFSHSAPQAKWQGSPTLR